MARNRQKPSNVQISYPFGLFGRETYLLTERAVEIRSERLLGHNHYVVDLESLDPVCSRYASLPRRWTSTALALGIGAVVLAVLCAQGPALGFNNWIWLLPALAFAGAAACVAQAVLLRQNCITFHRYDDGAPSVNLQIGKPDQETHERFLVELRGRIEQCRFDADEGGLAAELRGLDQLLHEGRLSEQEFRAAKATLLGMEPWQLEE